VTDATDTTFSELVLDAPGSTMVEFWAEWCGPCRALSPILETIATERADQLTLVKVNVDDNPKTAAKYRVTSVPSTLVFRGGDVVTTIIGAKPKPAIEHALAGLFAQ
jgi:thioredoxin 1